jgi:hypothetical protein
LFGLLQAFLQRRISVSGSGAGGLVGTCGGRCAIG